MTTVLERWITRLWNRLAGSRPEHVNGLFLGLRVRDGRVMHEVVHLLHAKRAEHIVILGRTGSGKSTLLRAWAEQDIKERRGFVFFDLHGDATPILVKAIAAEERRTGQDLSSRLIVIEPADAEYSVGLNVLEPSSTQLIFLQIAEVTAILKRRWHLESFGARTEELLRNSLHVLAENKLTLLEVAPLLTSASFRAACLRKVSNPEIRAYFESRYNAVSDGMRASMNAPVLNKLTAFTVDPQFRHLIGQQRSTFSLTESMDEGRWVVLNLDKGRLGEQSPTIGGLFLTKFKNALFARRSRKLFTVYCDEIQNLVAYDSGVDVLFSEARKFAVGISSANQFLEQHPPQIRSAILSIGTHIFFQLSSADAAQIATALDGGKSLAELLKNLPPRQFVLKSGHYPWQQVISPTVLTANVERSTTLQRSRLRWARRRSDIESEILSRLSHMRTSTKEALDGWE